MILLPASFTATHNTSGLAGFPAIDLFGRPGERVVVDFPCVVERLSGRSCHLGGRPGGAYGRSVYLRRANGDRYYVTHLRDLQVAPGDRLQRGATVGGLCDAAVTGRPGTTHAHHARRRRQP